MGAQCCVAARDKSLSCGTGIEVSSRRNTRQSPSWSFRWDNRTHIEDIMDVNIHFSHDDIQNVGEVKSGMDTEMESRSDAGSPLNAFRTARWRKSPIRIGTTFGSKVAAADHSCESYSLPEGKDFIRSSAASEGKAVFSIPSTPSEGKAVFSIPPTLSLSTFREYPSSSSTFRADPSSSKSCSLLADPASSRNACHSPCRQLARQVSDRIPALKFSNENSSPEGRQSVLSMCSNDQSVEGSQGGSTDSWTMRTFSELVASSQRERWSFDSENATFSISKIALSNTRPSTSPSADPKTCGICLKLLKDRSACPQKFGVNFDLAVVGVLVCGHVYHAECLESVTPDTDRYDPSCPVCTKGGKLSKLVVKGDAKVGNKISRIAEADVNMNGNSSADLHNRGKGIMYRAGTTGKSSFGMPFLRRRFSLRSPRPVSESESSKKKGFWARYRKDLPTSP